MTRSLSFAGVSLATSTYNLTVLKMSGMPFFLGGAAISTLSAARLDGAVGSPSTWAPGNIVLSCIVRGTSFSDLKTKLDAVFAALNSREDQQLILDYYPDRYWMSRLSSATVVCQGVVSALVDLTFIANDPCAYAVTPSTSTGTISTPPKALSLTCGGSADSFPTFTLTATASATAVTIISDQYETTLVCTGAVAAGDIVKIECDPKALLVSKKMSGADEFLPFMTGVAGQWPALLPGTNDITIDGIHCTYSVAWNSRYL